LLRIRNLCAQLNIFDFPNVFFGIAAGPNDFADRLPGVSELPDQVKYILS